MRPSEALREIIYPLSNARIIFSMLVFWLLGGLVTIAFWLPRSMMVVAAVAGSWLAIVVVPGFFRYALYLLEARAQGRDAPAPGIELFNWVENFWSLFPLLLLLAVIQFIYFVATRFSYEAAILISVIIFLLLPASMGILGVTRSPLASVNPIAIATLIKATGPGYWWAPGAGVAGAALIYLSARSGLPSFYAGLAGIYVFFMIFTMTGALLKYREIDSQVDIPEPLQPDHEQLEEVRLAERSKVANHAYGFVSRDNISGGLQHIRSWLDENDPSDEATNWFINEMFKWESPDAALLLAQETMQKLLAQDRDVECIKLLSRCLLADERFRPPPGNREAIIELLQQHGRQDLLRQIGARV